MLRWRKSEQMITQNSTLDRRSPEQFCASAKPGCCPAGRAQGLEPAAAHPFAEQPSRGQPSPALALRWVERQLTPGAPVACPSPEHGRRAERLGIAAALRQARCARWSVPTGGRQWRARRAGVCFKRFSLASSVPSPSTFTVSRLYPGHRETQALSRHKAARVVPAGPTLYLFHDACVSR